jgi:class 3 adenylate cyclase
MASDLPAHTRGFLFADLRGYSAFTERHGDQAARKLLTGYRQSVRGVIGKFDGAEIRTEGDSFYVVFDSVSQAVRAGLAILAAVAEPSADAAAHRVPVGIGIHAGEAEDSAEGIVSSAVNVAARICAQAEPGELLVSDTVRALTRGYLEVSFLPRGRRRLKGIAEPLALYRVVAGRTAGKAARGNRVRSALPSGYVRKVVLVAAAAVAVLAIAIIGGTLMREGVAGEDPQASVTPIRSQVAPSESLAQDDAYPTPGELGLLALLHDVDQEQCQRASPDDAPIYVDVVSRPTGDIVNRNPVPYKAGLTCSLGGISAPDTVSLWEIGNPLGAGSLTFDTVVDAGGLVAQQAGRVGAMRQPCEVGAPAQDAWSFGAASGDLVCYETETGDAIVMWSLDSRGVLGKAVRDDRDMAALLAWWTAEARFAP